MVTTHAEIKTKNKISPDQASRQNCLISISVSNYFTVQQHAVQYDKDMCARCTRGANHQPQSADAAL